MNRLIRFVFFILFFSIKVYCQPIYVSTYSNTIGVIDYKLPSVFSRANDGTYIGLTSDSVNVLYSVYKIEESGHIKWRKQILFPEPVFGIRAITLSDSSVAFLFSVSSSSFPSGVILKLSEAGNIRWCKKYSLQTSTFLNLIEPAKDGGMVLVGAGCPGADMDIRLDNNGTIVSVKNHLIFNNQYSLNTVDLIHEGNSKYTKWALLVTNFSLSTWQMVLYDVDDLGENTNVQVIHLQGECISGAYQMPIRYLTKATGGGYYAMCGALDTINNIQKGIYLYYFNHSKQLIWVKKIDIAGVDFNPRFLNPSSDNGCVIAGQNGFYSNYPSGLTARVTVFMKFDSTGILQWYKEPGDTLDVNWSFLELTSFLPAQNGGWFSVYNRNWNFSIARSDAQFYGYCNYNSIAPIVTPVQYTVYMDSMFSDHFPISESIVPVFFIEASINREDNCLINSVSEQEQENSFLIYPNPAVDFIELSDESNSIEIFNMVGELVLNFKKPKGEIDISSLDNGVYLMKSYSINNTIHSTKLLVQH